jgi:hypothetical protein
MEQMEVLEITNSSAISKISFNDETSEVGIAYSYKPETFYLFKCNEIEVVKDKVQTAESVGKLISQMKKDGVLMSV